MSKYVYKLNNQKRFEFQHLTFLNAIGHLKVKLERSRPLKAHSYSSDYGSDCDYEFADSDSSSDLTLTMSMWSSLYNLLYNLYYIVKSELKIGFRAML